MLSLVTQRRYHAIACEFFVEILEVYNEMVRDLLAPPSAKGGGEGHGLDIRLDPENPSEVIILPVDGATAHDPDVQQNRLMFLVFMFHASFSDHVPTVYQIKNINHSPPRDHKSYAAQTSYHTHHIHKTTLSFPTLLTLLSASYLILFCSVCSPLLSFLGTSPFPSSRDERASDL